jgi:hypothetical protein
MRIYSRQVPSQNGVHAVLTPKKLFFRLASFAMLRVAALNSPSDPMAGIIVDNGTSTSRVAVLVHADQMPTGKSPDDAFLLSSNEESDFDDLGDDESDASLPPISEFLRASKKVEPGSTSGMCRGFSFL